MLSIWARKETTPTPIPNTPVRTVPTNACNWLAKLVLGRQTVVAGCEAITLGFSFNEATRLAYTCGRPRTSAPP